MILFRKLESKRRYVMALDCYKANPFIFKRKEVPPHIPINFGFNSTWNFCFIFPICFKILAQLIEYH